MNEDTPLAGLLAGGVHPAPLKRSSSVLRCLLAISAVFAGSSALAQSEAQPKMVLPEIELERLTLNSGATGSLLLGTGELLPGRSYRLSLTSHYENDPLVLLDKEEYLTTVVKHRLTGHLAWGYGITDRLELSAQVPLLLMQRGNSHGLARLNIAEPTGGLALGTPYLGLRLGILSQANGNDDVDLAVGLSAGMPWGSGSALARDSSLRVIPNVMLGRNFGPVRGAVDVGMLMRDPAIFSDDANVRDEVGNEVRLGAMLATTGAGLRGELDVIAYLPTRRESRSVEALAGLRRPLSRKVEAYAMVGAGFDKAPGTPSFRGLLGVAFSQGKQPRVESPSEPLPESTSGNGNGGTPTPPAPTPPGPQGDPTPPGPQGNPGTPVLAMDECKIDLGRDKVHFDTGKARIQPRSYPLLKAVARLLMDHPEVKKIDIEGHTDSRDTALANKVLSQARAEAVRSHLVGQKVEPQRLEAAGFGEERLIIDEDTGRENQDASRRVEFTLPGCKAQPK